MSAAFTHGIHEHPAGQEGGILDVDLAVESGHRPDQDIGEVETPIDLELPPEGRFRPGGQLMLNVGTQGGLAPVRSNTATGKLESIWASELSHVWGKVWGKPHRRETKSERRLQLRGGFL